jgi:hypothetical protein
MSLDFGTNEVACLGVHDPEFTSRNVEPGAVEMKASRFFESLDVGEASEIVD